MRYLLIDFGASFIKTAIYNSVNDSLENFQEIKSPFVENSIIEKDVVRSILLKVVNSYTSIDRVVACSILGGYYKEDLYYSWKVGNREKGSSCLLSELFKEEKTFHIHEHHRAAVNAQEYIQGLEILGYISKIPVYSILGDTDCVTESLQLDSKTVVVNIGTGSQVIRSTERYSYIPAGRSFLVFEELFNSLGVSLFDYFKQLSVEDVQNSSLKINLNTFKQSHKYITGGSIEDINEGCFNIKNLAGSILKELVIQYSEYIDKSTVTTIVLVGGIPHKIPVLPSLFQEYYPGMDIRYESGEVNTHQGLIMFIKKYL
jgi:hypothetical protein